MQALFVAAVVFWTYSRHFSQRAALLAPSQPHVPQPQDVVSLAATESRRALLCAAFVAFSVLLRALFAFPFAIASAAQRAPIATCPLSCGSCQSAWYLVYEWIKDNPQIRVCFLIIR
jgi:hypothetical protein